MALTRLNIIVDAHKSSQAEFYGFHRNSSDQLIVTTTDTGTDNISHTDFKIFDDWFKGPSGITFSISNGALITTI